MQGGSADSVDLKALSSFFCLHLITAGAEVAAGEKKKRKQEKKFNWAVLVEDQFPHYITLSLETPLKTFPMLISMSVTFILAPLQSLLSFLDRRSTNCYSITAILHSVYTGNQYSVCPYSASPLKHVIAPWRSNLSNTDKIWLCLNLFCLSKVPPCICMSRKGCCRNGCLFASFLIILITSSGRYDS